MPSEPFEDLLEELQRECGAAVSEDLKTFLAEGKEDLLPEAQHIAQGMLKVGKSMAKGDPDAKIIWDSLQRQIQGLHAICYRRTYQSSIDLVGRVASVVLGIMLKRLGV